jgi:hypothetical protein
LQIKTKIVSSHTADSKPVKQEVNGTLTLPALVFLGKTIVRKQQSGGRERMREKDNRVRDNVLLRKGCGINHKFDRWANFSLLRKG